MSGYGVEKESLWVVEGGKNQFVDTFNRNAISLYVPLRLPLDFTAMKQISRVCIFAECICIRYEKSSNFLSQYKIDIFICDGENEIRRMEERKDVFMLD